MCHSIFSSSFYQLSADILIVSTTFLQNPFFKSDIYANWYCRIFYFSCVWVKVNVSLIVWTNIFLLAARLSEDEHQGQRNTQAQSCERPKGDTSEGCNLCRVVTVMRVVCCAVCTWMCDGLWYLIHCLNSRAAKYKSVMLTSQHFLNINQWPQSVQTESQFWIDTSLHFSYTLLTISVVVI